MTHAEAVEMIASGVTSTPAQVWLDLGAGTGVFTKALAKQLDGQAKVYAVDKQNQLDENAIDNAHPTRIIILELDFVTHEIPVEAVDGILMANSFHYVKEKKILIAKLKNILKPGGRFIFIEYDLVTSNQWVPYPVNFSSLRSLMMEMGFSSVIKINERPSVFNRAMMYSALVQ